MLSEILGRWFQLKPVQWEALEAHYELLIRWNKILNLTRIERGEEVALRHYGEALFVAQHLPAGNLRLADLGSGAGFPGFPIGIARPDCSVTLVESHQRKAVFLREATRHLPNFVVVCSRAEHISDRYDWVVSRAVGYQNVGESLRRLASNAALLTGAQEPPSALGFLWWPPIPLPWGKQRFLRVSRGTI